MKRIILALLLLVSPAVRATTVLMWGDGITLKTTPYIAEDVSGDFFVNSIPYNGEGTKYSLEHASDFISRDYDIIVANWGLWDMSTAQYVTLDEYRRNLWKLAAILKAHAKIVIIVSTTPIPFAYKSANPADVPLYNEALKQVAEENGFIYVDTNTYVMPYLWTLQKPNNIHFTQEGYQILSYPVADAIEAAWEFHTR